MKEQTKVPIYKRKLFGVPAFALGIIMLSAILVTAAAIAFHSINITINAGEARSSVDIPFTLSCLSGETKTQNLTISNGANVPLYATMSYAEINNSNNVTYTTNMPSTFVLAPLANTLFVASMTCNAQTPAGTVVGTITYSSAPTP